MLAFASREARRLAPDVLRRATCAALVATVASGCAPTPDTRARTLDARYRTGVFSWVVAHEPSALLIFGADADAVRPLDPNGRVAQAPPAFALACSAARDGHAALLVILPAVPANRERTLSRALDCGYAIARDPGGLVIAPR